MSLIDEIRSAQVRAGEDAVIRHLEEIGLGETKATIVSKPLTDKDIEEFIWEEISVPLNQSDKDNYTDNYVHYLNAVYWAKWGRDNCNGL